MKVNHSSRVFIVAMLIGLVGNAYAAPTHFNFESAPDSDFGDGVNPTFSKDGFTISFSTDFPIEADYQGEAQWTDDARAEPTYDGIGSMRLSTSGMGLGYIQIGVWLDFSTPVSSIEFYARQHPFADKVFTIEAYSPSDSLLTTTGTNSGTYELIRFADIGAIGRLRLIGWTNLSYFDYMTIDTSAAPEPSTVPIPSAALLLGCGLLSLVASRNKFMVSPGNF